MNDQLFIRRAWMSGQDVVVDSLGLRVTSLSVYASVYVCVYVCAVAEVSHRLFATVTARKQPRDRERKKV